MAKVKKAFFCKNCGFEAPKWLGRCPSCGEWNTFAEEIIARESGSVPAVAAGPLPAAKPQRVRDIRESEHVRLDLGNAEVNRVLGGGMVPGSLVLRGRRAGNRQIDPLAANRAGGERTENPLRLGRGVGRADQDARRRASASATTSA